MQLAATTKISAILKAHPAAIDAIVSINSHFGKLRNPVLRKILASRVTIADAARIGNCRVEDFYEKLLPLGFSTVDEENKSITTVPMEMDILERPAFMATLNSSNTVVLDVRAAIAANNGPFRQIMDAVNKLEKEQVLCIVNTFEPIPLIAVLRPKGFDYYTETPGPNLVKTYFKKERGDEENKPAKQDSEPDFEEVLARYGDRIKQLDVRQQEMPQPMVSVLSALETLPEEEALYVLHRKVPQFLLPQLAERGFRISIKHGGPNAVYLLIYK